MATSCTRRFLHYEWEHHTWRPRVTSAQTATTDDTNMWGRVVHSTYARCHKQDVCEVCGKTRREKNCICDAAFAEHCAVRLACLDRETRR